MLLSSLWNRFPFAINFGDLTNVDSLLRKCFFLLPLHFTSSQKDVKITFSVSFLETTRSIKFFLAVQLITSCVQSDHDCFYPTALLRSHFLNTS